MINDKTESLEDLELEQIRAPEDLVSNYLSESTSVVN